MKKIEWQGTSYEDLKAFPLATRKCAGYQLDKVQKGQEPDDWKPMATVGAGVKEIRIREEGGAYRVFYVANIGDAIYVLHAFQKKTEQTSKKDIDLAKDRFKSIKR